MLPQDKYILVSMCFLGFIAIWHAIVLTLDTASAEGNVMIALAAVFVIFNSVFFVVIYFRVSCMDSLQNRSGRDTRVHY